MKLTEALSLSRTVRPDARTVQVVSALETHYFEIFLKALSVERHQPINTAPSPFGSLVPALLQLSQHEQAFTLVVILDCEDIQSGASYRSSVRDDWLKSNEFPTALQDALIQVASVGHASQTIVVPPVMDTVLDLGVGTVVQSRDAILRKSFIEKLQAATESIPGVKWLNASLVLRSLPATDWTSVEMLLRGGWPYSMMATQSLAAGVLDVLLPRAAPGKLVVTDLDDTVWQGIIGEDGVENVTWEASESSLKYLIYQRLLNRLMTNGVLVAVCSKNEADVVSKGLERRDLVLNASQLVSVRASWSAKSEMISDLLSELNLLPESAVFVDDNPYELDEVSTNVRGIVTLRFPENNGEVARFAAELFACFDISHISDDDRRRAQSYRARKQVTVSLAKRNGQDVDAYLQTLEMVAAIETLRDPEEERPKKLLNKTNQFNLNAIRETDASWTEHFRKGRHVFKVNLRDRLADHGTVMVGVLRSESGVVEVLRLAMSCRVFSRNLEYGVFHWLQSLGKHTGRNGVLFWFRRTGKNSPLHQCIERCCVETSETMPSPDGGDSLSAWLLQKIPTFFPGQIEVGNELKQG